MEKKKKEHKGDRRKSDYKMTGTEFFNKYMIIPLEIVSLFIYLFIYFTLVLVLHSFYVYLNLRDILRNITYLLSLCA